MRPLLLHVFPTFAPGGAQMRTVRLMAAFGERYRHAVLSLDGDVSARELVPDAVALELLPTPPKAGSLTTAGRVLRLLATLGPDVVCTYNWGAIDAVLAGGLTGQAVLHHEDGFRPDEADGFKARRVWTRRIALRRARAVVVPSFTLAEIAANLWRLDARRIRRVANGIRIADFAGGDGRDALRRELGIPADAPVVGYVGHLRTEKNPGRLIEAVARMEARDRVHVLVLGEGPERERVETLAREAGLAERVHLVGHQRETAPYYHAMDAFAISSDTEQMPVALLEAMACRLPVASTDVGDVKRILPELQRALVVDANPHALAGALDRIVADGDAARALGAANFEHVRATYSFDAMVDAYRELYDFALA